jgi:hypothetical protein
MIDLYIFILKISKNTIIFKINLKINIKFNFIKNFITIY